MTSPKLDAGSNQSILLGPVLRDVSRSFYLTLRALPGVVRLPIGLAYLLARAADTIADTEILPSSERLRTLLQFRRCLESMNPELLEDLEKDLAGFVVRAAAGESRAAAAEKRLLGRLHECLELFRSLPLADQIDVCDVVCTLISGMEQDLATFRDPTRLDALHTLAQLEDYTYLVAGCVGPFWTRICVRHVSDFRDWDVNELGAIGIKFGKALQWTNVLRDIPRDVRSGRCYLPSAELQRVGLRPEDLKDPANFEKLKPLYDKFLDHALGHYRSAWEYTLAIPASQKRIRLACIWPQWIGLETISLLRAGNPLDPNQRIKINRKRVYSIMFKTSLKVWKMSLLEQEHQKLMAKAAGLEDYDFEGSDGL
jgi:farnesyl-diphosphate farnesyltransferase